MKYPTRTDPLPPEEDGVFEYIWLPSRESGVYYAWAKPVANEVQFRPESDHLKIELGNNVDFHVYKSIAKQELLYRIAFMGEKPKRFMLRPYGYCMFWSYGVESGPSSLVKYFYRDKYVSLHSWVDKRSYLAVLRQQHYVSNENSFWSR